MSAPIHELRQDRVGDVDVVRASGEIDLSNADALAAALQTTSARRVALELGGLSYIDSAGIRAVDQGYRALHAAGRKLVVVLPPDSPAEWIFKVTGLADGLRARTLDEALALLHDGGG